MNPNAEQWILGVMSGRASGVGAAATRAALAAAEPAYAGITRLRNRLFERGSLQQRRLSRPVISIGNITTGGTGKTPAVQWLAAMLKSHGHRPGILLRGYRREAGATSSDEEQLLRDSTGCPVVANADRYQGGVALLAEHANVDIILLDDGFQHRRLARDVDIVLIDATNPFGFGHVLPRGLLREPLSGLGRADLVIITRADLADADALSRIESTVRTQNAGVPIVRSNHRLTRATPETGDATDASALRGRRVFAFSGIGNPQAFDRSLQQLGVELVGAKHFPDHHAYRAVDIHEVREAARATGAAIAVTTEKDWVKVASLVTGEDASTTSIVRVGVRIDMSDADEARAWTLIGQAVAKPG